MPTSDHRSSFKASRPAARWGSDGAAVDNAARDRRPVRLGLIDTFATQAGVDAGRMHSASGVSGWSRDMGEERLKQRASAGHGERKTRL